MALFKVLRGDETNLPASMNDGWAYFCTDTGNFYIDWDNGENLVRTQINSNYANKLRYMDDEELVEINPQDIALKSDIPEFGTLATKDSVSKSDLATDIQASLGKADTALQSFTETDPTVPAWAKASTKPNYTASEVGLGNVDNVKQYSASNPPPYPVESVNGKTGTVTVNEVPSCSTSDNGKFLRVVGGVAAWVSISNAEEATF